MPIQSVNDFVVRFANVNGSGSASANELFARSVMRMGVPVSPRNIFPSNIQGLPTWYEVRITEAGHLGARGGVDLMVAMNPQTFDKDVASIEKGGYLFYDSTKPLPASRFRDDITVIGIPLTAICNREYIDPRQRQLFKNIIYVGALAALLDMDVGAIEKLIAEQFRSKDTLIEPNVHALHLGRDYVTMNLEHPIGLKLKKANAVGDRIFIEGNSAAALGAVYGGATVCAWYPITPSSSLAEAFQRHCSRYRADGNKKNRYAIIQAEDELSSIGIVIGAAWNGSRAFTATSGPGISLMQEFLGLAYFAEIPAVIVDVQRAGPSTGMPTRTQQCDILNCAYASHGDTKHVLLFPEDPAEAFEMTAQAFDLADRLQTPIFVMTDLDIGMNHRLCRPLKWDDERKFDRGKIMTAAMLEAGKDFGRYLDIDNDGIPFRTLPGTHPNKGSFFTRGTSRDRYARYTEEGAPYADNMQRLLRKFETAKSLVPRPVRLDADKPAKYGAIYFGSTSPAMDEAIHMIAARGAPLDMLRVRGFPFHQDVSDFISDHDFVFVVEQNRDGQLRTLITTECNVDPVRLVPILHFDGTPITARFIANAIGDHLDALKVTPLRKQRIVNSMAAVASALRNLAPKAALVLVSIAVSLVIIEVGLRAAGFEPRRDAVNIGFDSWAGPNVEMGWVNRAGTWKSAEPGNVPMSFEPDGRRSDPAGNKSVSLPRVLVVGCSFTQGYGVADDQTFSHFVNQSLPSAELLNFGTGAYGSYQSRLRVNHYFKAAHPKTPLVIYGLFYSHHLRDLAPMPWILSLTMKDGSYMVPPNIRMRSGEITESPGGPIGLWLLESRTASVALLHRAIMKLENRVTIGMVAPVFRHGILAMQEAVAANKAALLIVGLVPIAPEDLEWLQAQSRDKVIDFVACEHPDYDKDPSLKVGGVGHPSERLHRWWADCTLKALAARGYAVDASVLSSTGQPAVSKTN